MKRPPARVWEFTTSDKFSFCVKAKNLDAAKWIAKAIDPKVLTVLEVDEQTQRDRGRAIYGVCCI